MVQRIALLGFVFLFLSGFTFSQPSLKLQSPRGIYRFERASGGTFSTQNGGLFSLAIGVKPSSEPDLLKRAQYLLKVLERGFYNASELSLKKEGVAVSVASIYAATHEVILNVQVADAGKIEAVKGGLLKVFSKHAQVRFVGEPGQVSTQ